ncbi:aquaporin-4 [Patella vulgata]|uniref:aquaporin-4 n=1 Tax=Patella vulgata TaxID=6465 RepID=UPI00217F8589|nr:aquaporin-4 [Patella vulgata]
MESIFLTIRRFSFWKAVKCEFLLTMFYVLVGCASTIPGDSHYKQNVNDLKVALAFGITSMTLMQCFLPICGPPQMNPAITIAMLCTRRVHVVTSFIHIFAQCLGGLAGAGILYGVTPARKHDNLGVTMVHNDIGRGQAFGIEFIITFIMTFAYFAGHDNPALFGGFQSAPVGLSIMFGHTFGWQFTGASMNPARSLGPAIVCNEWSDHWVYWIGPVLGSILGGITYEYTTGGGPEIKNLRRNSSLGTMMNTETVRGSKESVDMPTELTFTIPATPDPEI